MPTLQENVKRMIKAGVPKDKISAYIKKHSGGQQSIQQQSSWAEGPEYKQTKLSQEYPERQAISRGFRTFIEGTAAGLGGVGGVALTGGNPLGGVAGAGLMYGAASNVADRFHEWLGLSEPMNLQESTVKAVNDVAKGMTYEMGGGAIFGAFAGFKRVFDRVKGWLDMSDSAALRRAEEVYNDLFKADPDALKTAEETDALMKRMGVKTKLTAAQKTGSKEAALKEQSLSSQSPEMSAEIMRRRDAIRGEAQEALSGKMGPGSMTDAVDAVAQKRSALEQRLETTRREAEEAINPLYATKPKQELGENIYDDLSSAKDVAKREVDAEYAKIPEGIELSAEPVTRSLKKMAEDVKVKGGGASSVPSAIVRQIRSKTKKGTVTFDQLRDWRSQISEEVRDNLVGANPNLKVVRRLRMIQGGVDDAMEQMLKGDDAAVVEQYKKATELFRKFHRTFRDGAVGDVLPASQSIGPKVGMTEIPAKFFTNADKADDLIRAVGREKASSLIDDYAAFNLANTMPKGSKAVKTWIFKNQEVLNKYGLFEKYSEMAKKMEVAEVSADELKAFNKTVAGRVLDANIDDVIKSVFGQQRGKVNSATLMNDLLSLPGVKGNIAAENGIKSGFKDFLLKQAKSFSAESENALNPVHTVAKFGRVLDEYKDAISVIYKGEPEKIKALKDYHKVLSVIERNRNVSASGGSTTAEKLTETKKGFITNALQLAAVKVGSGWVFSTVRRLWDSIINFPKAMTEPQVEDFLKQALLDPDAAATLFAGPKIKNFERSILRHAITMGIVSADNELFGDDERND